VKMHGITNNMPVCVVPAAVKLFYDVL